MWSAEDLLKLDHWQATGPDGPSASLDHIDDFCYFGGGQGLVLEGDSSVPPKLDA